MERYAIGLGRTWAACALWFCCVAPTTAGAVEYGEFDQNKEFRSTGSLMVLQGTPTYPNPLPTDVNYSLCSGNLIDERVFLTAAHCLEFALMGDGDGVSLWVAFEADNLVTEFPETVEVEGRTMYSVDSPRLRRVDAFVVHPSWNRHRRDGLYCHLSQEQSSWCTDKVRGWDGIYPTDLALVILSEAVKNIKPAKLAPVGFMDREFDGSGDQLLSVVGYGYDSTWPGTDLSWPGYPERRQIGQLYWAGNVLDGQAVHLTDGPTGQYTGTGDSGSGLWWTEGDDDDGDDCDDNRQVIVGVHKGRYYAEPGWMSSRVDTLEARRFIDDVIAHVDDPAGITEGLFAPQPFLEYSDFGVTGAAIDQWLVLGPYEFTGSHPDSLRVDFLATNKISEEDIASGLVYPEEGLRFGKRVVAPGVVGVWQGEATLDLGASFESDNVMGYAWTYAILDGPPTGQEFIGVASDDAINVQVNGTEVFSELTRHGIFAGYQNSAPLTNEDGEPLLVEGCNLIQAKVFNFGGSHLVRAALFDGLPTYVYPQPCLAEDGSCDGAWATSPLWPDIDVTYTTDPADCP